ncbi:MAG: MarC family protein [gamma proteobacterium symbiont of Taylorina sp.]|nr:MarC family protein [gamma proteobacterium symbiont of Taylorina sp.]
MSELIQHTVSVFLAFFAIMNPIANTAVFVGLTGKKERSIQKKIAYKALLTTFFIIMTFSLLGNAIFHLFGITLPALRVTGGILVFLIGYQMLHGENSKMHKPTDIADADIAISPLAVPILAGPGTIATAMNYSATGSWGKIIITMISFSILCLLTYVCFIFGQRLVQLIGDNGINIVTRLMGLILAIIGVQMLLEGVFGAISDYTNVFIKTLV